MACSDKTYLSSSCVCNILILIEKSRRFDYYYSIESEVSQIYDELDSDEHRGRFETHALIRVV